MTSNQPARRGPVPWPIAPMKAASGTMPHGDVWRFEPKWDGHRALVRVRGERVDVVSSSGASRTEQWSWIAAARAAFLDPDAVYDGEVIAYDEHGSHSFGLVGRADRPHALVVFDLLAAGGTELMSRPWEHRRARLEASLAPDATIQLTPVAADGAVLWDVTRSAGFEGVVAKRVDSLYLPGRRTTSWRKVKHRLVREFVVAGWTAGDGARAGTFGSLLLGAYDAAGLLRFVGAVGTGFDDARLATLTRTLHESERADCPFPERPVLPRGGRPRWVEPVMVVQVEFAEWTEAGHIRHPVHLGPRDDKQARDVHLED